MTPATDRGPGQIEIRGLTKRFGSLTAVDDLDFTVQPGRITGFLGPNGSGKTTTLRMLLGLVRPNAGTATIDGRAYHDIPNPLTTVGSALEATNFHPGRTGRDHLRVLATVAGVSDRRVDELLELVGIPAAARSRAGGYSMGMRQRLGLAGALLGDPQVIILDEPANGLDPEGIRWLRGFLRHLASEGRTLLISSHMLSEVEQTVDDVVIIANGRRVAEGTIADLHGDTAAYVRSSDSTALAAALSSEGITTTVKDEGLLAHGTSLVRIGEAALRAGIAIYELRSEQTRLEELFFSLTESPEYRNRNLGEHAGDEHDSGGFGPVGRSGASGPDDGAAVPPDLPPPTGTPVPLTDTEQEAGR